MTDAQPLDDSQISYLKGVVSTLRGQKLSVDEQTMREILATIDNLTDQVAWLSAASNDAAKQIKAIESERDALRVELDALKARPVRVKPLVFQYHRGHGCLASQITEFGRYIVGRDARTKSQEFIISTLNAGRCDEVGARPTEAEAIAFAQSDYERRILSALDLGEAQARPAPVVPDQRPADCRERLRAEGKPYGKSSCQACGLNIANGMGTRCLNVHRPAPVVPEG